MDGWMDGCHTILRSAVPKDSNNESLSGGKAPPRDGDALTSCYA